ncbi:MAG: GAF domain-containing protein [Synergistaceae bacterium]|jgi:GAF domain-containing protein|nr:GAF domain-containing protein [Synergistaceae bacterium]
MIVTIEDFKSKNEMYGYLESACAAMIDRRDNVISSLANAAALIKIYMKDVNWAGFYLFQEEMLTLGPFQGGPAVTRIKLGKGVCGLSAERMKTVRVDDVTVFDSYIACDNLTLSEIVVPLVKKERLIAVLDIDSPLPSRFDSEDEKGLEKIANTLVHLIYM